MPYAWESGLVFDETIVSNDQQNKHKTRCMAELLSRPSHIRLLSIRPKNGSNTLYDMAMRLLLTNVDRLELDALAGVPGAMLGRIWSTAVRT